MLCYLQFERNTSISIEMVGTTNLPFSCLIQKHTQYRNTYYTVCSCGIVITYYAIQVLLMLKIV